MKEGRKEGDSLLVPGIAVLLAFLSGIGFGLFMGSHFPLSSATEDGGTNNQAMEAGGSGAQTESQADAALNSRIQELENELAEEKSGEGALILQDRLAFFKKHNGFLLQAFRDDLKVTPEMVDALGLTKDEQQAIEQHLAQMNKEVDQYEDANATLLKQSANSVTFEIPANPGGKDLQTKFNSLISSDVGDERAELFLSTAASSSFDPLSGFDEQRKQIEIKWENNNGSPLYTINEDYFNANGVKQRGSGRIEDSLPEKYAKFLQAEPGQ